MSTNAPVARIIIIMYIYRALINALCAHMKHIDLNIFYTHIEPNDSTGLVFMHIAKRLSVVKLSALPVQPNATLPVCSFYFRLSIACQSSHRSSERLVSASLFTQDHKMTLGYLG